MNEPVFRHEFPHKIRLAAIGCGGHAVRNVLPACNYAPIDLVAICDLDRDRAVACAGMFGACSVYTDQLELLVRERPDAVLVVTNYDSLGHPRYPAIAVDALRAGANVWIEKPPAASSREVIEMQKASAGAGKFVAVGFM